MNSRLLLAKYSMILSLTIALAFLTSLQSLKAQDPVRYVNPFIGSGGHGHVFVGASVPFGAVQTGPDNFFKGWDWDSGYHYGDSVVIGFAQTHLSGTGIGDLGDVLIMPYTGAVKTDKGTETIPGSGYASRYSHKQETARPGYYSVHLSDYDINVELTASERVAFHQYHFPAGKEAHVIIDLKEGINDQSTETYIRRTDLHTLVGYRYSKGWAKNQWLYFAIRSSEPLDQFQVYDDSKLLQGDSGRSDAIKGLIGFNHTPALLKLKVGISPVSTSNALANIDAEIPGWDFQQTEKLATEKWNRELSKVSVETKNEKDKCIFYTALFHAMIDPALFNDHNKDYRGTDKQVYKNASFNNYSVFSLWDTYRAENPLFTLLQPERVNDMINSMLAIYQQQGMLPIWHLMGNETGTMPGISGVQIVAEAYLKGFRGFDRNLAYEAVKTTAMSDKLGLKYARDLKWIPSDQQHSSVAKGLEYSISDGSIARIAREMGKSDDYQYFLKRSENYKQYFDPATRFFRGRTADGRWDEAYDPFKSSGPAARAYAEGNSWQYLWLVPQDVNGLMSLLGGEQNFLNRLDSLFIAEPLVKDTEVLSDVTGTIGQYAHGNEPSHHIIYLYAYGGQPWKTAEKARFIMKNMYLDDPDGVIGNEDCGQMSAWYIFSALGFYPVFPASGEYVMGSPLFDKATLHLPGNKDFTVEAINNGPENIYIQSMELNGKKYDQSFIRHEDILRGGLLKIVMGNQQGDFGKAKEDRPGQ
ncbi:MAG: GH92 family glycosyl hydrolase [Bacteroidota bacterium]|nr:GH92 family glycosyl hydrolase [Bacteroidota bacterium]